MSHNLRGRRLALALMAGSFLAAPAAVHADIWPAAKWLEPTQVENGGAKADDKGDKKKGLPMKPGRKVEFQTDEGTWLALDVSPDGSTIVFELLGDIYTVAAAGGEARPLLTGMAFQSQPVYSPDGSMIAYLSDEDGAENLYVAKADGTEPKKLSGLGDGGMMSPSWSADGLYVYVSQLPQGLGANEIWMYHKLGGSGIQITKSRPKGPATPRAQQSNAQGAVASPDGKYIYYAQKTGGFSYDMDSFPWSIVRRNMTEGTVEPVATAYGSAMKPELSPDGKTMVYATRFETETGLRVRNLETGEDRWLAYPVTRDDQESRATRDLMPSYSFTPDGTAVLTTAGGKIERIDIATGTRTVIPFTAKVSIDIGPNLRNQTADAEGPVVARLMQAPSLSPDGKALAFSALGELYTLDLTKADSKPKKLANAGSHVFQPTWSRDGRTLAYISWTSSGGHVWRLRADGKGKAEQVSKIAAYYTEPTFTPDGSEIVAIRASNHQFNLGDPTTQRDLVALNAKTGAVRTVLAGAGFHGIHFGDARDRVYLSGGDGLFESGEGLFSVRLDGTDRRDHIVLKGAGLYYDMEPVTARDMRLSPDGKFALARSEERLHVLAVPPSGGSMVEVKLNGPSIPLKTLFEIGADHFGWAHDGQTIWWSVGSSFYEQKLSDVEWVKPEDEQKDGKTEGEAAEAEGDTAEATEAETKEVETKEEKAEEKKAEPKAYTERSVRIEVARDKPEGVILLSGATVLTMADAGVIENADVLVVDGKFKAVGAKGSLEVPEGTQVRDMMGKYITPGFVDTHGHWQNWSRNGVIEDQFWPFIMNLAYGVTSGLDVQTSTTDIFAYQDMVDAGRMIGFRAWSTGPGVFSDTAIKSAEHARDVLSRYRDHYRTKNIKSYVMGNRKSRQYLLEAAKELGMMPTTEGALDTKLDLTHMIDGYVGNEHAIPIVPLYRDIVELSARTGVSYTPTLLVTYGGPMGENYFFTNMNPHDDAKVNRFMPHHVLDGTVKRRPWFREEEYSFTRVADGAIDIQRAGGLVGVGSHGEFQGLGYHWEMWALGSGKATPMEVLKAATIDGARIIGHETEVGSIEPGKHADLVILDKDPRTDIKNTLAIHRVMMNGRLYDDDTMNEEWPRERALPAFWFADQAPKP